MSDVKDPRILKEMNDLLLEYGMAQKLPVKNTLDQMNKQSYIDDVVKRMNDVLDSLGKAALVLILILAMSAACFASVPGRKDSFTIGYSWSTNSVVTADRYYGVQLKQTGVYIAGESPITENITLVSHCFFGNSTLQMDQPYSTLNYSGLAGSGELGIKIEW